MRWLLLLFACAACSSKGIGSIGDHRVEIAKVAAALHAGSAADPMTSIDVIATDDGNFPCENVGHVRPAAARSLALRFFSLDGGVYVPPPPGTYRVIERPGSLPDGQYGYALYVETTPICDIFDGNSIGAHEGTLTLTEASFTPGASVAGKFDVTLLSTDHLAGSFAARLCETIDGGACR